MTNQCQWKVVNAHDILPSSKNDALENIPTVTRLSLVACAVATEAVVSPQMPSNLRLLEITAQTNMTIATTFGHRVDIH